MDFLNNQGFSDITCITEEVFSANHDIFDKVVIKKVLKSTTEFKSFLNLKHENIVEALQIIEAEEFAFVVMKFAEFGDVFDYIMTNGLMSQEATLSVFTQVVKAVEYCHAHGIAHSDIKMENVLLFKGSVKLIDFGFAKASEVVAESDEFCGTLPYAAPEVVMGMEYNTMKADVWSLGVLLYVLLFGAFPFPNEDATSMVQAQLSRVISFPKNISNNLKALIASMLEPSIDNRMSANSILLAIAQL